MRFPESERHLGRSLADAAQGAQGHSRRIRRRMHGHVQRHHRGQLLNPLGVYKERLSQSALVAAMREVTEPEAQKVRDGSMPRAVTFMTGPNEETDLTDAQILDQCKMYIAAMRIADEFGCDAIGIQYQQGLKDMAPASDLVEGLLNNVERPPVFAESTAANSLPAAAAPFQRSGRVRRPRRACDQPRVDRDATRSGHHAARCALGRALHRQRN